MDIKEKKRILELDYIKGICIIGMIIVHCFEELYAGNDSAASYLFVNVLNTATGATAFMFCMGFGTKLTKKDSSGDYFKRGFMILTLGIALNVAREDIPLMFLDMFLPDTDLGAMYVESLCVDIMVFAGMAFMLLGILRKCRLDSKGIAIVALVMSIFGSFVQHVDTGSYEFNTILCFFIGAEADGYFPLCNWFIFVAAGRLFAEYYLKIDNRDVFWKKVIPIALIMSVIYIILAYEGIPLFRNLGEAVDFCWMYTTDALGSLCCIMFYMGVMYLLAKAVNIKPLRYMSEHINNIYVIQWMIILPLSLFMLVGFIPYIINSWVILTVALFIILGSVFLTWLYLNFFAKPIRAFCNKTKVIWLILIWVSAIAFFAYSMVGEYDIYPGAYNDYVSYPVIINGEII